MNRAMLRDQLSEKQRLLAAQREANEQLLLAALRAHEQVDASLATRARAKDQLALSPSRERELAEFREMVLGFLGHDLKNPLISIMGSASALIRRGYLAEHDAVAVARILRSSETMCRLVTRLLDFTRARLGGGMTIDVKPVDLRHVCQDVLEDFDAPSELTVEGDVAGRWDEQRLTEALTNLVGNAVRYANPDSPVVLALRAAGPEVVLEVKNQGQAISADALPFLFEPFRRTTDPGDPEQRPGLGLYLAHQVVLAHGGTLAGHSAGGTTTFAMRLPRYPNGSGSTYDDLAEAPTQP
jgi:signal transduction histidine kinase